MLICEIGREKKEGFCRLRRGETSVANMLGGSKGLVMAATPAVSFLHIQPHPRIYFASNFQGNLLLGKAVTRPAPNLTLTESKLSARNFADILNILLLAGGGTFPPLAAFIVSLWRIFAIYIILRRLLLNNALMKMCIYLWLYSIVSLYIFIAVSVTNFRSIFDVQRPPIWRAIVQKRDIISQVVQIVTLFW